MLNTLHGLTENSIGAIITLLNEENMLVKGHGLVKKTRLRKIDGFISAVRIR